MCQFSVMSAPQPTRHARWASYGQSVEHVNHVWSKDGYNHFMQLFMQLSLDFLWPFSIRPDPAIP